MNQTINDILTRHQLRLTKPRQIVFNTLKQATRPLSIVELAALCPSIDTVSVYRTVNLFTKLLIITTTSHGWKLHYELAEPFQPHHHHMRCLRCGAIKDINSPAVEQHIAALGKQYHFTVLNHGFEINGICQACATPQGS